LPGFKKGRETAPPKGSLLAKMGDAQGLWAGDDEICFCGLG